MLQSVIDPFLPLASRMIVSIARLDCSRIHDEESFHDEFNSLFGFPGFYGRNMDAWIDCMSYLDDPNAGMTSCHVEPGRTLTLELVNVKPFREKHPNLYADIVDCSAFVNARCIETGPTPLIALAFRD